MLEFVDLSWEYILTLVVLRCEWLAWGPHYTMKYLYYIDNVLVSVATIRVEQQLELNILDVHFC